MRYIPLVRGRVTYINRARNFGFITLASGEEVFFHREAVGLPWALEDFELGDKVVFNMVRLKRQKQGRLLRGFQVKKLDSQKEKKRQ